MASKEIPANVRSSWWWRLITVIPIVGLLGISVQGVTLYLVFVVGRTHILGLDETGIAMAMAGISVPILIVMIVLPYALYRDLQLLEEYTIVEQWKYEQHQYIIGALAGFVFPLISFVVAGIYLYERHGHLSAPNA